MQVNILVTGASGFVGSALIPELRKSGHKVLRLVRSPDQSADDAAVWDPLTGRMWEEDFRGVDAVVHLAGEPVVGRWTQKKKKTIYDSRVHQTRLLCEGLARMESPPKVFVSASAIGYYGERGDEIVDEESPKGNGFLADVAGDWEEASAALSQAGARVVHLRIGLVLGAHGGALARMLLPFKLGLGGILGSGKQWMSWIGLEDLVGLIQHALLQEKVEGPLNAVAPNPVSNYEFTKTLGKVLRRPTLFPVPAFILKFLFGEMAEALLLGSTRVLPNRTQKSGYTFRYPHLEGALRHILHR